MSLKLAILFLVIVNASWTYALGGPGHATLAATEHGADRRADAIRGEIRFLRLEITFVEERIAWVRQELKMELRELPPGFESAERRQLQDQIRKFYGERERRLRQRQVALQHEVERLVRHLAKKQNTGARARVEELSNQHGIARKDK